VVGEEAVSRDPDLLNGLGEADLAFILDPVDGTLNFASGLPLFGVMAAVLRRGEVICGIILDPMVGRLRDGSPRRGSMDPAS
jgi:fructose-1,6-bisphosphatase/inositol monophosphatase family enzyme